MLYNKPSYRFNEKQLAKVALRGRFPKDDKKYSWTRHVVGKMQYYRIAESTVKRIIRSPKRVEKGVAEGTLACMQQAGSKKKQELWVMYQPKGSRKHIITAWRYPGISPVREAVPIPQDILDELKELYS